MKLIKFFGHPGLYPLAYQADNPLVGNPVLYETDHPFMGKGVERTTDIRINHLVHPLTPYPD